MLALLALWPLACSTPPPDLTAGTLDFEVGEKVVLHGVSLQARCVCTGKHLKDDTKNLGDQLRHGFDGRQTQMIPIDAKLSTAGTTATLHWDDTTFEHPFGLTHSTHQQTCSEPQVLVDATTSAWPDAHVVKVHALDAPLRARQTVVQRASTWRRADIELGAGWKEHQYATKVGDAPFRDARIERTGERMGLQGVGPLLNPTPALEQAVGTTLNGQLVRRPGGVFVLEWVARFPVDGQRTVVHGASVEGELKLVDVDGVVFAEPTDGALDGQHGLPSTFRVLGPEGLEVPSTGRFVYTVHRQEGDAADAPPFGSTLFIHQDLEPISRP